jgi:drug/metabolite transporter (DMT)-like permease
VTGALIVNIRKAISPLESASDTTASLALMLGGALWGVIWIPIRALEGQGLPGAWPGMLIYAATLLLLFPLLVIRWRHILARFGALAFCGLGTGAAFSFYATSILLTDVVHAILLFYLTPVWGTLLGIALLGERLTLPRIAALCLGLGGLAVVLGGDAGLPWPRNTGDWLALAAGLAWAIGTFGIYRTKAIAVADQMLAFMVGALVVTGAILLLGGDTMGGAIAPMALISNAGWGLLIAFYVAPMLLLTLWPATRLTPGRVGLLLMTDVIAAVASAAWLAGEPFGAREILGSLLMISAALVEVLGKRP